MHKITSFICNFLHKIAKNYELYFVIIFIYLCTILNFILVDKLDDSIPEEFWQGLELHFFGVVIVPYQTYLQGWSI